MTGNLEAYYTDRKEYRKKISGKYGKNLFEFLGGDASFTRQDWPDSILRSFKRQVYQSFRRL